MKAPPVREKPPGQTEGVLKQTNNYKATIPIIRTRVNETRHVSDIIRVVLKQIGRAR